MSRISPEWIARKIERSRAMEAQRGTARTPHRTRALLDRADALAAERKARREAEALLRSLFAYGWQTATVGESPMSPRDGANAFTTTIAGALCIVAAFACVFFTTLLWEKKP